MNRTGEKNRMNPEAATGAGQNELDRILAEMAEETPNMPADFHEKWTRAVREEAVASEAGKTEGKSGNAFALWRRLAGIAAVAVFLVGGTLLTRDRWHPEKERMNALNAMNRVQQETAADGDQAVEAAGEAQLFAANEAAPAAVNAAGAAVGNGWARDSLSAEARVSEKAVSEEAYGANRPAEADRTAEAAEAEVAEEVYAPGEAEAAEEACASGETDTVEEAEAAEEAEAPAALDAGENTERSAKVAAAPAGAPLRETGTEEAAEAKESGFVLFLKDMGRFVLLVWPYLAGAAALVAAVTLLRRKTGEKDSSR